MIKKTALWIPGILFLVLLHLSFNTANGDIFIKKVKHTDAFTLMGKQEPAKEEDTGTWISKEKYREDDGEKMSYIVRLDQNKIYLINHKTQSYSEAPLPINLDLIISDQAKQLMESMKVSAKVEDTGETSKIKDWNCRKYLIEINISMMGMNLPIKQEIWASKDLGIDLDLYHKFTREIMASNPMTEKLADEILKIKGYPVLIRVTMTMMGTEMKFKEEVISVEKKDAPEGTYEPPKEYKKSEYNPFSQQQ